MEQHSPTLSSTVDLTPSSTLAINERVRALWANGQTVYHFGFGESRFPVHPKLQAALAREAGRSSYLAVQGLAELREAIAGYYGERLGCDFSAETTLISPGSKASMFALQMALDADLILPQPSWVSYAPQAKLLGRSVHWIASSPEKGYRWTLDDLTQTVQQMDGTRTKLMILNSPNNPTGLMFSAEFLQTLATFCRQHNIYVLSDELYDSISHGAQPHVSLAQFYPEGTVVMGGLSKRLGLGGWRLGHAILPAQQTDWLKGALKVASEVWSCAAAPMQYAALDAYRNDPDIESYIKTCQTIHTARTQHVWSWLSEFGIRCPQPQGAFYMMPDFDRWREPLAKLGVTTSAELATHLLDNYQIAALPGSVFGQPPSTLSLRLATSYLDMENEDAAQTTLDAWDGDAEQFLQDKQPMLNGGVENFGRFIRDLENSL